MTITGLPEKFNRLWERCEPVLSVGRPGDDAHAVEVAELILANAAEMALDLGVLIPTAIMHDIGHAAILPEHFKYITGEQRLPNGKLVHMLAGAKIAREILDSIGYDPVKAAEIVDIISMHDADQLEGVDIAAFYDSDNKKIFHDVDCMDRFNLKRIKKMEKMFPDKNKMFVMLEKTITGFFDAKFKGLAERKLLEIKKELSAGA